MTHLIAVHPNSYKDSIRLLEATRAVLAAPGGEWGWALMATPANIATLEQKGFTTGLAEASANDLIFAVRAEDEETAKAAISTATEAMVGSTTGEDDDEQHAAPG